MPTPEPKPTLLTSIGVGGGGGPATESPATEGPATEPAPESDTVLNKPAPSRRRRRNTTHSKGTGEPAADDNGAAVGESLVDSLEAIRQQHRQRRSTGARMPLAPLNVDIPLELLEHLRRLSQDIPYPLRRMAEEAIELWLEASGNQRPSPRPALTGGGGEQPAHP